MAALTTRPHTLAVDLDLLVSSSSNEDAGGTAGPDPSFTYFVGERPASASPTTRPTGSYSDSFAHQASNCSLTRHAWLRPGIRRFLLAVHPHFRTVLVVRRRCGARQRCGCRTGSSVSADGSHGICSWSEAVSGGGCDAGDGADIGAGARNWVEDVGGCSAALLAAALPAIDPDGQFFGERVVLVQEQPLRPRTATTKASRASAAGGDDAASGSAGLASAAAGTALFPARARRLSALPAALNEHPSSLLVVTTADRSLFCGGSAMDASGSLAEQVVECQPYRKEYGKYDDVLDCLATVVTGLLAEASVPVGLRRLGLLHSRLQPSLMMQALHAKQALRHQPPPQPQGPSQWQATLGQAAQAAVAPHHQQHEQLVGPGKEQHMRSGHQQRAAAAARKAGAGGSRGSRRSRGGRGDSCSGGGGGGEERGSGGSRGGGRTSSSSSGGLMAAGGPISVGASASPLPPIPELPLLELDAEWLEDVGEGSPAAAAAAAASPPPPSARSSASTASSSSASACGSAGYPSPYASSPPQSEYISSPSALSGVSDAAGSGGSRPSSSSVGSGSLSSRSMCVGGVGGAAGPALSSPPPGGRRTAWDAAPGSPEGAVRPSLTTSFEPSGAAVLLRNSNPPPAGAGGGSGGGGGIDRPQYSFTGDSRGGGWRPGSFPAATKPPVTRYMSDCASQMPPDSGDAARGGAGKAAAAPPSPFTVAANAVAAATSRLFSRILGGRRRRRCRPSDVGEDAAGAGTSRPCSISVTALPGCSAASDSLASRTWIDSEPGAFFAAASQHHGRAASTSSAAPPPPSLLQASPADPFVVRTASVATPRSSDADDSPSSSAASTASVARPAAATAATAAVAVSASRPPSAASGDPQPRPQAWSDPSGKRVPLQSPLRTTHTADGGDPAAAQAAAAAATAATAAFPQRLSVIGRSSAASGAFRDQQVATAAGIEAACRPLSSRPVGQKGLGEALSSGPVSAGEGGRGAARCSAAAVAAAAAAAEAGVVSAARAASLSGAPAGSLGPGGPGVAAALFRAAATATAR